MNATPRLPAYYSRLRPFQDLFAAGLPVLTYHKVGPRPWRTRLKGLYVSPSLFQKQLAELRAAGYETRSLDDVRRSDAPAGRRVVLTFDDGFRNVWEHALAPLARCGYRAIQFLVADRLGRLNDWEIREGEVAEPLMDAAQVRDWLAAGHEIGAHSLTHPRLTQIPLAQAREEISASRKKLEDLFSVAVRHFCYPYGDCNDAVCDLAAEAGYATACTTRFGVNTAATPPYQLNRVTARYPSRNLKTLAASLVNWRPWARK